MRPSGRVTERRLVQLAVVCSQVDEVERCGQVDEVASPTGGGAPPGGRGSGGVAEVRGRSVSGEVALTGLGR